MQIGHAQFQIEDQPLVIVHSYGEILLLGEVKSKVLLLEAISKQSTGPWQMQFAKYYGLKEFLRN